MSFIERDLPDNRLPWMMSYAQQAEDVMLRRGLWGLEEGFYIDAGAGHPVDDSVTKYFSNRGWWGINIEPQPDLISDLNRDRPRDINLQVAIAKKAGELQLRTYPYAWGWASVNSEVNDTHTEGIETNEITVNAQPLSQVLEEHDVEHVNFLKVDVEGSERDVLETAELGKWQPDIVVVEATKPSTRALSIAWEDILLGAGYNMALFDGLNRFYSTDLRICNRLSTPANTFDSYVPYRWWRGMTTQAKQEFAAWKELNEDFTIE